MKTIFTISLLLILSSSQASIFNVKYHLIQNEDSSFPIIETSDSIITLKINHFLQLNTLGHILELGDTNFHSFLIPEPSYGLSSGNITSTVMIHENHISVFFNRNACVATCYAWIESYNFDLRTGDQIFMEDLFLTSSLKSIKQKVSNKIRKSSYEQSIKLELDLDTICFDFMTYIDNGNYYFENDSIFYDISNSQCRDFKYSDIQLVYGFPIQEFRKELSHYGRNFFFKEMEELVAKNGYFDQLLVGVINEKYSIELYLSKPSINSNRLVGFYAYDKYKSKIDLEGELINNQIIIYEIDDDLQKQASIQLYAELELLKGKWSTKEKTYKLELKKYITSFIK